ncbi:MAG: VTT domain-containing protein [Planctomycetota bacterium]|nr:VTT domain-containing protein [Planctomycetota bacterium]
MPEDSLLQQLAHLPPWVAFWTVVLATLISEDIATITAGMAAAAGLMPLPNAIISSGLGIWLGDFAYYLVGRSLGFAILQRSWFARMVNPATIERCRIGFASSGIRWIIASRFMPGMRTVTYLVAGCLQVRAGWFALTTFIAVAVWTPIVIGLAYFAGEKCTDLILHAGPVGWLAALFTLISLYFFSQFVFAVCTPNGRHAICDRVRIFFRRPK